MALSETPRSLAIWDVGFSHNSFSNTSADGQVILGGRGAGAFRLAIIGAFAGSGVGRLGRGGGVECQNVLAGSDSTGRFL